MTGHATSPLDVLYVDDDPDVGTLVREVLERGERPPRCVVTPETSPDAAIERLEHGTFDCVVSDYTMPVMNGIEFLETVRERHPDVPLVLFSSAETSQVAAEVVRAGLTDYLRKGYGVQPYTMLLQRVGHAVASSGRFEPSAPAETVDLGGMGVLGVDDRFERVGEQYASRYAYDAAAVVGKHWSELHPPAAVEHIKRHVLPVVASDGQWRGVSEGVRADGTTFTEYTLVTRLDDGRVLLGVTAADAAPTTGA